VEFSRANAPSFHRFEQSSVDLEANRSTERIDLENQTVLLAPNIDHSLDPLEGAASNSHMSSDLKEWIWIKHTLPLQGKANLFKLMNQPALIRGVDHLGDSLGPHGEPGVFLRPLKKHIGRKQGALDHPFPMPVNLCLSYSWEKIPESRRMKDLSHGLFLTRSGVQNAPGPIRIMSDLAIEITQHRRLWGRGRASNILYGDGMPHRSPALVASHTGAAAIPRSSDRPTYA
jgi:hypothetical protein